MRYLVGFCVAVVCGLVIMAKVGWVIGVLAESVALALNHALHSPEA